MGTPSSAVVTIVDDDTAGISVTPTSGLKVTEAGGTATFAVNLMKQPGANVSIGLSSSDTTEGTVSPTSLIFTPVNWHLAQTVTILGINDYVDDGDINFSIITAAATSTDSSYNGMNASDVAVTNIDNDTAGITVTPTSGVSVSEGGGTTTFTVVLTSQPGAAVNVGLSSSDITEGTVLPTTLTFTTVNWNEAKLVTVTGVDDPGIDGNVVFNIITASATSTDTGYHGMNASDVEVVNIDDDIAGITVISATGLTVSESGGTVTFVTVLNRPPANDVSIDLSSSDTSEGTISSDSLTFTTSDWYLPQTVTITGVEDFVDDGDIPFMIITAAASSSDTNYNGIDPNDISVTNKDDDTAGITITPTSSLIVSEAGGTATLAFVLTSQPGADVNITLSSSDTSEGTVSPDSLTFTSEDWATPQEITVSGVDDVDVDGNVDIEIVTGAASSTDDAYNGMNAFDILITNIDDDNAPPTALQDLYATIWRSPITVNESSGVLNNDSDTEDDPLTAELVLGPSVEDGTLIFNDDGSFTFTPAETISGNATFTYRAFDGFNYSDPVTVTIQVIAHASIFTFGYKTWQLIYLGINKTSSG